MRVLVTGSSGHLGEALVRTLRDAGDDVVGLDVVPSPWTTLVGSVADRDVVRQAVGGADGVLHTATLHKPHVAGRSRQAFVDVNVTGTLTLLEEAAAAGSAFVLTSTTSVFGRALVPPPGQPAAWITEDVAPMVKNVYGATKTAAEDLLRLVARDEGLPCVVLRTSRFFPEGDDVEEGFDDLNLKTNELLHRRVDLQDVVDAHRLALARAAEVSGETFVVSATTPFLPEDAGALRVDARAVVRRRVPGWEEVYAARGWRMAPSLDRVYDNARARERLGWEPRYGFAQAVEALRTGADWRSPLALQVGAKGYGTG